VAGDTQNALGCGRTTQEMTDMNESTDLQAPQSPDGLWWWNGQQWLPTVRQLPRRTFKMTWWRWAWIAWCCAWGVFWGLIFWPMAAFSFACIAFIALRTKGDDERDRQ
jgi:hypothetical protein